MIDTGKLAQSGKTLQILDIELDPWMPSSYKQAGVYYSPKACWYFLFDGVHIQGVAKGTFEAVFVEVDPKPTSVVDVDGILERKGKFLILEWKRDNEEVSKGQQYMLQALASKPDFTVVILIGNTDTETIINRFFLVRKAGCILMGHGFEEFKKYYIDWYKKADGY